MINSKSKKMEVTLASASQPLQDMPDPGCLPQPLLGSPILTSPSPLVAPAHTSPVSRSPVPFLLCHPRSPRHLAAHLKNFSPSS